MLYLNLLLVSLLSLVNPSLGQVVDYVVDGEGKKCPYDDSRLFKFKDTTLEACRDHCDLVPACRQFTFGTYKGVPMCMGCDVKNLAKHDGFTTYKLTGKKKDSKGMTNLKCPLHHPRLFRIEDVMTLKACEHQCLDDPTCSHYSYGMWNNKLICIGCDAQLENGKPKLQKHVGFTTYESRPATEFETCTASAWGDPHVITFDGYKYDVHVPGEVIFLRNATTEIQGRLEKAKDGKMPAVTTGVAMRGNDPSLPVIQLSMSTDPEAEGTMPDKRGSGSCPVELFVNGELVDITGQNDDSIEGIDTGSDDATVVLRNSKIFVEMPELRVDLTVFRSRIFNSGKCFFSMDVHLLNCNPDLPVVGIFGSPNDKKKDDWMRRDGSVLTLPQGNKKKRLKPSFEYVKEHWLITDEDESLFEYDPGTSFSDYATRGTEAEYDPEIEDLLDAAENDPELEFCKGDTGCLMDGKILSIEDAKQYMENPASSRELTEGEDDDFEEEPFTFQPEVGSHGDPHFKTWKNEHYEYHGQCDMVLVKDENFANGIGLEVQIRTKMIRFWSYIKQASIRIGDDILEIEGGAEGKNEKRETRHWINLEYQGKLTTVGGFPVKFWWKNFARRRYVIDLSSKYPGQSIELATFREFIRVDFHNASEEAFGNTVGLLGDFKTGKTVARDGVTVMHDYYEFGSEWQVLPFENMLFHDVQQPQFPQKCIIPEDPRGERRRRLDESTVSEADAEAACASIKDTLDRKDCVYDVLATQDLGLVGAY